MHALSLILAAVFLNGVNIEGLRGQTFEKCRAVRIDERGDVHLDCPAYQVEQQAAPVTRAQQQPGAIPAVASTPAPPLATAAVGLPAAGPITKHYWLVTEQADGASAQYEIDVFVNSKWIRKLKSGEEQIVMDVTKYLQPGPNKILFAAAKKIEGSRKSASPSSYLKVIVGEGESGGNNVMIDNPLFELKRTAAETASINQEFTVQAR